MENGKGLDGGFFPFLSLPCDDLNKLRDLGVGKERIACHFPELGRVLPPGLLDDGADVPFHVVGGTAAAFCCGFINFVDHGGESVVVLQV